MKITQRRPESFWTDEHELDPLSPRRIPKFVFTAGFLPAGGVTGAHPFEYTIVYLKGCTPYSANRLRGVAKKRSPCPLVE